MNEKITLITCRSIEKEIRKVIEAKKIKKIDIKSYFCDFDNDHGQKCDIENVVSGFKDTEELILLVKKSCVFGGKEPRIHQKKYYVKSLTNLFELFLPEDLVKYYYDKNYYLLTSGGVQFWLNNLDTWGLTGQNIFELTNTQFDSFLILDTKIGLDTKIMADKLSKKVDLPYEIIPVGLDFLEIYLNKLLTDFRLQEEKESSLEKIIEANEKQANYEIAFDLIKTLTQLKTENDVIKCIELIFEKLFSPKYIEFAVIRNNKSIRFIPPRAENSLNRGKIKDFLKKEKEYSLEGEHSFNLKLIHKGKCYGIIKIGAIEFPEYISRYLSLAIIIARICALAINNARVYQKLNKTLKNLKESNKDLEQFAYIVSHDLKQPLTIIMGYLNMLKKIYQGEIDMDPLKPLNESLESASNMDHMITNLLEYSKFNQTRQKKELLDLNKVLKKAMANLRSLITKSKAEITHDELPEVHADETQMTVIFQNLLENAMKYSSEETPKVNISSDKNNRFWIIKIEDNGIGIDASEQDKIFELFYRSNRSDATDGTGIGLSICKKAVERLGGKIWVESKENSGSIFNFTIPVLNY
ncbi:MAG: putative Histidine kinase [Promethearchaeota archaeon]|nr:MAG: putative Histidine kinase [Candidatus Lokiarchaeota archaeon]